MGNTSQTDRKEAKCHGVVSEPMPIKTSPHISAIETVNHSLFSLRFTSRSIDSAVRTPIMRGWKLLRIIILFGLVLFFIVKITESCLKLNEKAIGTSTVTKNDEMLLFPSVTVCFRGRNLKKLYPSVESKDVLDR